MLDGNIRNMNFLIVGGSLVGEEASHSQLGTTLDNDTIRDEPLYVQVEAKATCGS